jgi:hypothetical protein
MMQCNYEKNMHLCNLKYYNPLIQYILCYDNYFFLQMDRE